MIRTLLKYLGEYKRSSILAPLSVFFEVLLEVMIPTFVARIIDTAIPQHDMRMLWSQSAMLIVFALVSLFFGWQSGRLAAHASAGFARNLRRAVFQRIQGFSFSNIDKFSSSGLITRLTTDITNIQNAYQLIVRMLVRTPSMLILSFIMAFRINHELALLYPVIVVVLGCSMAFLMLRAHPIFHYVFNYYDNLNLIVQENVRGIRVVKSYVREEAEKKKFFAGSQHIYENFVKAEKIFSLQGPLMQSMIFVSLLTVLTLSAHMIVRGNLTTGELTSMVTYIMLILFAVMLLSMTLLMVVIANASAKRVTEVLTEESDITSPKDALTDVPDGSIQFRDVSFSYAVDCETTVLHDINLSIESGQTIGVVGDTGAGKSTLVQLIPRLYEVDHGQVCVGGHDVREYDLKTLRDKVAIVLQKNVLFSGTILENLRWGNEGATLEECIHACKLAQAHDFISELPDGYNTHIEQGGSNVSGGQKQRICIARALLKQPAILILDDSTSAVDTGTEALLRRAFADTLPHVTKLIIAQRISSVADADAIIVMHGGVIEGFGTHEHLYATNTFYKEIHDTQSRMDVVVHE
ncbi:MAG: ABC transporter ATP-binding protein/permease [Actinomycetes bacterium]|jgi:ATP-binding cassette subfamily B protein|nr:ABC transporter ATP-binding protein/permease [Actinomycetes bacterium]